MKITVKLLGTINKMSKIPFNGNSAELDVPEGALIRDVISILGLPLDIVKINLINGRRAKLDTPVKNGDILSILPPMAGG